MYSDVGVHLAWEKVGLVVLVSGVSTMKSVMVTAEPRIGPMLRRDTDARSCESITSGYDMGPSRVAPSARMLGKQSWEVFVIWLLLAVFRHWEVEPMLDGVHPVQSHRGLSIYFTSL